MAAVWAYSKGAPGKTCEDARLLGGGTNLQYPAGNDQGQAGWDIGVMFSTMSDLSDKLQDLKRTSASSCAAQWGIGAKRVPVSFTRLAINLHGMPGKIDADSTGLENGMYDFDRLWGRYSSPLQAINKMMEPIAMILIMGCNVGKGPEGDKFLNALSTKAFPNHKVVGFTTIGKTERQFRRGEGCTEPGMRDTPYDMGSKDMPFAQEREQETLTLPWASETSPHAKVVWNGKIIFTNEVAIPPQDYSPQTYMPGLWSVTIGDWRGYFVFSRDGGTFWRNEMDGVRHMGRWTATADSVQWSYSDDSPGWTRLFQVVLPLSTNAKGKITVKGVDHGFFVMSKQD